jgi:hypothetical protein
VRRTARRTPVAALDFPEGYFLESRGSPTTPSPTRRKTETPGRLSFCLQLALLTGLLQCEMSTEKSASFEKRMGAPQILARSCSLTEW